MDSLLKNAVRVYTPPQQGRHVRFLGWRTDTTQLAVEWPTKLAKGRYVFRTIEMELPSGKRRPLGENIDIALFSRTSGVPSPNGKWVLSSPLSNPEVTDLTAVTLDGKQKRHWAVDKHKISDSDRWLLVGSKPLWVANGTAWVMLAFQDKKLYALTGSLLGDPLARIIPLGTSNNATGAYSLWPDTITSGHLIESPDGDLIRGVGRVNDYSERLKTRSALFWRWEFRLSQGQRSRRETPFEVPFPKSETVLDIAYSPQSQRLAAFTFAESDRERWSIHTMRLDGSQRLCLGTVTSPYPLEELDWLPSGKKLSFRYDNALWVVPDAPPKQPQIM
ncbi:hypothetical protein [Armatimonas sp.]|uniref:hypothetical protein n=1 Tax=Armatimonas sp. TaxID=1872638 RepID=UPI003752C4AF